MSLLDKILRRRREPPKRVRICVECGMPLGEGGAQHKDWCSIYRAQRDGTVKATAKEA